MGFSTPPNTNKGLATPNNRFACVRAKALEELAFKHGLSNISHCLFVHALRVHA